MSSQSGTTVVKMQVVEAEKYDRLWVALLGGCSALGVLVFLSVLVFGCCFVEIGRIRRGQEAERARERQLRQRAGVEGGGQGVRGVQEGAAVVSSIGEVPGWRNIRKTTGDADKIEAVYDTPCGSGIENPFSEFALGAGVGSATLERMKEMTRREMEEYDAERAPRHGDIVRARGGRQGGAEDALHPKVGRVKKRYVTRAGFALRRLLRGEKK